MTGALQKKRKGKRAAALVCLLLIAAAAAYAALCAVAAGRDTFYPGWQINGVDVGGLNASKAAEDLDAEMEQRQIFLHEAGTGQPLAAVSVAELGYTRVVFEDEVRSLLEQQRSAPFLKQGAAYLFAAAGKNQKSIWIWPERDEAVYKATVLRLTEELSAAPVSGACVLVDDVLSITRPSDGWMVSAEALGVLRNTNLYVTGGTVEIAGETAEAEPFDLQAACEALLGEMVNAEYDRETDSVKPDRVGAAFDVSEAQRLFEGAKPGETVSLPADVDVPDITAEELRVLLFRDVLGECRTPVEGEEGRVTNVRLSAAAINGHILLPGEEFSYNAVVGKRTAAKGYRAGPAYVNGKTVMEIGGGICQTSSTLYSACLRADLKITERKNHGFTPDYIDWGTDSAVSWGGPDYRFVNNTGYPVKIVTEYDGAYLTVKLLGTNTDGGYAEVKFEVLTTVPWTTQYVEDPSMAPGSEGVVMVEPYTGHKVTTTHILYDAQGNVIDSHFEATSNYKVRNKIIHVPVGEVPETEE